MKAVIFAGGKKTKSATALQAVRDCDLVFCADKGIEYAVEFGITPDYAIGDMDSVNADILENLENTRIIRSSPEKDYTDTHLAVIEALSMGCFEIDILCATGLRSDHALANIRLLLYMDSHGAKGRIIDDCNTIYLCTGKTVLNGMKGLTVSIMSISEKTRGINLSGFRYQLNNHDAGLDWTTGISNVIISDEAYISLESGKLLVFEIYPDMV